MKKESEYEVEKQKNKQKLVRNEFLNNKFSTGKFEFPIIRKQDIDLSKIELLSFVDTKNDDVENKNKTIHFFTYDWKFEKVYQNAEQEVEKIKQYYAVMSPDFSIFTNMPIALQIESVFKNRWCGAYWQSHGVKVIPTVSWGDERSFSFCFDGIEEGAIVAVCTYYRENCEEEFMLGYNEMLKRIKPSTVICYDKPFKSMKGNIMEFTPTTHEWIKNLDWKDQTQFEWEKRNKNIIGLNKKDFKFFDYKDPYELIDIKKCDVCGNAVSIDQYGNGDCSNCGWSQDQHSITYPDRVQYPNVISLNKAKNLYKNGKPFVPDFDDFLDGLFMYSEMEFTYNNEYYGVCRRESGIEFFEGYDGKTRVMFKSRDEFKNKASIDGMLLKDIWENVINAGYMQ